MDQSSDRPEEPDRLQRALDAFDRANAADPNLELVDGEKLPKELIYGQRMSAWLDRLCPEASEALRLAVRCQHIERWVTPRGSYPEGRIGYLTWRRDLKRYHAERAGEILTEEAVCHQGVGDSTEAVEGQIAQTTPHRVAHHERPGQHRGRHCSAGKRLSG